MMRFCMVSTFYPPYHFGGDAVYVQRLSNALARRGHVVDVIHDKDAYALSRRDAPSRGEDEHANVHVRGLQSSFGLLSPLATQQTGRPWMKPSIRRQLESGQYDVIHFHNPSLIGSTTFRYGSAVKLYTLHEHWLICPMHVLWKFDREPCEQPSCVACCLRGGRPPQLWRYTDKLAKALRHIDRFLSPSRFTRDRHRAAGLDLPTSVLPHFTPAAPIASVGAPPHPRPYFLFVGRLVKLKGVDTLLNAFRQYRDADLLIAGDGEEASTLKGLAADLPHVRFLGRLAPSELPALYHHAVALVMPSIGYEVFGLVLLEAFAQGTPVIVRDLGGMPEVVNESGGGLLFRTDQELLEALQRLRASPELRMALGRAGYEAYVDKWSERPHLDAYLEIVESLRRKPPAAPGA